jgi:hypothetical protein
MSGEPPSLRARGEECVQAFCRGVDAGHAAAAICAARLHSHSERRQGAIQGFLELLAR